MNPPCDKCYAACCKHDHDNGDAVMLDPVKDSHLLKFAVKIEGELCLPTKNGKCIFLKNNRCSIYNERPQLCRSFNCIEKYKEYPGSFFFQDNPNVISLIATIKEIGSNGKTRTHIPPVSIRS
jgi:Fe-S-cluster containining protein